MKRLVIFVIALSMLAMTACNDKGDSDVSVKAVTAEPINKGDSSIYDPDLDYSSEPDDTSSDDSEQSRNRRRTVAPHPRLGSQSLLQ